MQGLQTCTTRQAHRLSLQALHALLPHLVEEALTLVEVGRNLQAVLQQLLTSWVDVRTEGTLRLLFYQSCMPNCFGVHVQCISITVQRKPELAAPCMPPDRHAYSACTVQRKQSMDWFYCNILIWHQLQIDTNSSCCAFMTFKNTVTRAVIAQCRERRQESLCGT